MKTWNYIALVLFSNLAVCVRGKFEAEEPLDRGWGETIEWKTLENGLKEAKKSDKPLMLLIYKTWCGACKALKPVFVTSQEIAELSKRFVMVNVQDEEEPKDEKYHPDGRYIPRILFLSADGEVMEEFYNQNGKHKDTKYYYGKTSEIVDSMKSVLKKTKGSKVLEEKEEEPVMESNPLARGFGDRINWVAYEDGLEKMKKSGKWMLLLIHKTWCGSCKALKPKLSNSKEFAEMSRQFVMVNTEDEEEPKGSQFVVDGEYIPRVLFLNPEGKVVEEIWNEGTKHPHVKYYYSSPQELISGMKRALKMKETGFLEKPEEKKEEQPKEVKEEKEEKEKDPWWKPKDLSRGFGDHINWVSYEKGLKDAKESNKNMLLIIHKSWCSSCKVLRPNLAKHKEFAELSKDFVMVNTEDNDEPKGEQFDVDGKYVPRIFFLDSNGNVQKDLWNEGTKHKHVKYYYQNGEELVTAMKKALKMDDKPKAVSDDGWGKDIEWSSIDEGFEKAKEGKKPMMLIIHKSWCGACKNLKKKFAKSSEIIESSKQFVMVNIEDDSGKIGDTYDVDGAYAPRIYFLDPFTRQIMEEFHNTDPSFKEYKYAYAEPKDIAEIMKKVLKKEIHEGIAPDKGFGAHLKWLKLDNALEEAKTSNKPIMMVLHKSWCQISQNLKPKIAESKEIAELSKHFLMVNLEDDEIPKDGKYDADGSYVPRIVFLDSDGNLKKEIDNENTDLDKTKYFYKTPEEIVKSMKKLIPEPVSLDRGFGKDINWMTMEKGLEKANKSETPVMLIIHKSWCGACKALKPIIAESKQIAELSKKFVMINVEDDEEPKADQFEVDGKYFPRVFFLNHKGEVQKDLHNNDLEFIKYKFFYNDDEELIHTMKTALKKLVKPPPSLDRGLGKEINWMKLEDAYEAAKKSWKPIFLFIHKSWCSACQAFKPKFAASQKIKDVSKDLVMVNVEDEFDDNKKKFKIDGEYFPRIVFMDPLGNVMEKVSNAGTVYKESKYYYWEPQSVVRSMEKVLDKVKTMTRPKDEL
ncbi:Thioredoxin domain-containing protein 12 [Desmophyllum pertusum]|uniref:Thioredoxin domain-containing protein 12 n=1 Tax=Desmophyllum pertusum TaxID=174260 RepID=A0A9W9ZC71_9CNID|nr:Thioredoxin domain-containing protein 12 [Desmophyllum pertusum]